MCKSAISSESGFFFFFFGLVSELGTNYVLWAVALGEVRFWVGDSSSWQWVYVYVYVCTDQVGKGKPIVVSLYDTRGVLVVWVIRWDYVVQRRWFVACSISLSHYI